MNFKFCVDCCCIIEFWINWFKYVFGKVINMWEGFVIFFKIKLFVVKIVRNFKVLWIMNCI